MQGDVNDLEQPLIECGKCQPRSQYWLNGGGFCSALVQKNDPLKDVIRICSIKYREDEEGYANLATNEMHLKETLGVIHVLTIAIDSYLDPIDLTKLEQKYISLKKEAEQDGE